MKKAIMRNTTIGLSLAFGLLFFQNCGKKMSFLTIVPPPREAVVCGGFDTTNTNDNSYAVVGNLFVSNQTDNPASALKYASDAVPLKTAAGDLVSIYFNNIDVPNRAFTEGFVSQDGAPLKDQDGNLLFEYFGLKLRFTLKLPDDMDAGYYEIAIQSDDGSVLKMLNDNNEMKTYIDNDSTHSVRTACPQKTIYLDHTTRIPSELFYFQGPRTHIALRMLWKKMSSEAPPSIDLACDNTTVGSADGTSASNFWKVLPAAAYELPTSELINPCVNN